MRRVLAEHEDSTENNVNANLKQFESESERSDEDIVIEQGAQNDFCSICGSAELYNLRLCHDCAARSTPSPGGESSPRSEEQNEFDPFLNSFQRGSERKNRCVGLKLVKIAIRQGWVDNFQVMPLLTSNDRLERRAMMIRASKRANHKFEKLKKKQWKKKKKRYRRANDNRLGTEEVLIDVEARL